MQSVVYTKKSPTVRGVTVRQRVSMVLLRRENMMNYALLLISYSFVRYVKTKKQTKNAENVLRSKSIVLYALNSATRRF